MADYVSRSYIENNVCGACAKLSGNNNSGHLYTCSITSEVMERLTERQLAETLRICGGPYKDRDEPSREKLGGDWGAYLSRARHALE